MARRLFCIAVVLLLWAGCGQSTPLTLPERALRELQAGRYDDAVETCNEAIHLDSNDSHAYHYRGKAYHYRNQPGDIDRAIADFTEAIRLAPKDPEALYSRSIAYRDRGDAEESAKDETKARELDSNLKEVYAEMADMAPPGATPTEKSALSSDKPEAGKADPKAPGTAEAATDEPLSDSLKSSGKIDRTKPRVDGYGPDPETQARSRDQIHELLKTPQYKMPSSARAAQTVDNDDEDATPPAPRSRAMGRPSTRAGAKARTSVARDEEDPYTLPPRSPFTPSSPYGSSGQQSFVPPSYQRPVQSPFQQAAPRPTGFYTDVPASPFGSNAGVGNPFSGGAAPSPTVHPPGAYQQDFNP